MRPLCSGVLGGVSGDQHNRTHCVTLSHVTTSLCCIDVRVELRHVVGSRCVTQTAGTKTLCETSVVKFYDVEFVVNAALYKL